MAVSTPSRINISVPIAESDGIFNGRFPNGTASTPTFSPAAGSFSSAQTVTISDTTPGSTIYFTTDGTTPTFPITGTTQQFTGPIAVSASETLNAIAVAPLFANSAVGSAAYVISAGNAGTEVFNFENFSGVTTQVIPTQQVAISGAVVNMTDGNSHHGGGLWFHEVQNVQSFVAKFSFVVPVAGNFGFVCVFQNSNETTNPAAFGFGSAGNSANGMAYGAGGGASQPAEGNSVGLVFDNSLFNDPGGFIGPPIISCVSLCVDGGPAIGVNSPVAGYASAIDMKPFGLNTANGNKQSVVLTYDGTILTMVLTDTVTLATTRLSWPINIPVCVGGDTAIIGFQSAAP
jgi:hypothetical protein